MKSQREIGNEESENERKAKRITQPSVPCWCHYLRAKRYYRRSVKGPMTSCTRMCVWPAGDAAPSVVRPAWIRGPSGAASLSREATESATSVLLSLTSAVLKAFAAMFSLSVMERIKFLVCVTSVNIFM